MPIITNIGGGTLKELDVISTNTGGGTLKELNSIWTNAGGGTMREIHSPGLKRIKKSWNGSDGGWFEFYETSLDLLSVVPWKKAIMSTIELPENCTVKCTIDITITDGYTYRTLVPTGEIQHFALVGVGEPPGIYEVPNGVFAGTILQNPITPQLKIAEATYTWTGTLTNSMRNIYALRCVRKLTGSNSVICYPAEDVSMDYSIKFEIV